jgi:L-iditol 2-dehydrogenase
MQAALLFAKEDLRVQDIETPRAREGEVVLRTGSASICGTDIRMLKHGHAFATPDKPLVIGHEMAGTLAEVGPGVTSLHVGQRVCIAPNYNPEPTRLVALGEGHLDGSYRALGIHEHGAFAEYVRIPRDAVIQGNVFPIADHVSFAAAALVEPLACVYNAYEKVRTCPGDTVLIIGAGPIGLMHAKISRMAGASRVIVCDVNADRLAITREIDPAFITVVGDPGAELNRLTHGAGADVVITACPVAAMQTRAVELAAVNGRIVFFGGLPKGASVVPLDTNIIHYKQLLVTGTTRQSLRHFQKTLDLVSSGVMQVEDLITATYSISEAAAAITGAMAARGLKTRIGFAS